MTIADLDLNEIQAAIKRLGVDIKQLEGGMSKLQTQIKNLKTQINEKDDQCRNLKLEATLLNQALILKQGVNKQILESRNNLLLLMEEAKREDITIARKKELDGQIEKAKKQLQELCDHRFLFGHTGYKGSYSCDHEDCYHGYRLCVVCGTKDNEVKICEGNYGKLYTTEKRLLKYDYDQLTKFQKNIWQPLEPILETFADPRVFKILRMEKTA